MVRSGQQKRLRHQHQLVLGVVVVLLWSVLVPLLLSVHTSTGTSTRKGQACTSREAGREV